MSNLWGVVQQRGQLALGSALGIVFECLTTSKHQHNDDAGPILPHKHCGNNGGDRENIDAPAALEDRANHADGLFSGNSQRKDADDPARGFFQTSECENTPNNRQHNRRGEYRVSHEEGAGLIHYFSLAHIPEMKNGPVAYATSPLL